MSDYQFRLGDLIDDFCPRCKLLLNHAIASLVDGQVVKVICKTCYSEHAYRRGEGGKKKAQGRMTLFDQVLSQAAPSAAAEPPPSSSAGAKKKRASGAARYISRHKARPGRK
jgi:hypothetical protein